MNAIEKIISQMNEAAEQERAALEQEERMKIDQNFEQKRTQIETEHQKQKEKQIELLEKKYRQLRNRQQVEVRQENLNAKQEWNNELPFTMVLSDESVAGQAGFLINDQGVQYNFLFSSLVQDIQGTMSFEIANQLFE